MFEMLRKMIFPIIIIVLVFFVGMIVLQWGLGLSGRNQAVQANVAGTINGEEIPWQTHSQLLNNLYQKERANRGEDYEIPDDRARELEQQAWDELVADKLIKQEGVRLGLTVSETDVYNYLKYNPPQFLQQEPKDPSTLEQSKRSLMELTGWIEQLEKTIKVQAARGVRGTGSRSV